MAAKLVVLAAGAPRHGSTPTALIAAPDGRAALRWTLDTFADRCDRTELVAGFRHGHIQTAFPHVHITLNPDWKHTTAVDSLAMIEPLEAETWIVYGDVLHHETLVARMPVDSLAIEDAPRTATNGKEPEWVNHERGRGQFAGLMRLSPRMTTTVREWCVNHTGAAMMDLLEFLGPQLQAIPAQHEWVEFDDPADVPAFILGTKAETLERLGPRLESARVPDQVVVEWSNWQQPSAVLQPLRNRLEGLVAVRSSSRLEDAWDQSNAGAFESILNVDLGDDDAITAAVDAVFASYGAPAPGDQVLVQPMVENVRASGVITTRRLGTGGPYITVHMDTGDATDTVTGGTSTTDRTFIVHRGAWKQQRNHPAIGSLVPLVQELEHVLNHDALDIEFALDRNGPVLLQVRPLVLPHRPADLDAGVERMLEDANAAMKSRRRQDALLGLMPDWNPAEIIGVRARRLAKDLYRYVIMDETWARQRAEGGYRDVRPSELLLDVAGHPYVRVEASLESFIPASLDDALAERLVAHGLQRLRDHPSLHDKVEFEVAFTAWSFDLDQRRDDELPADVCSDDEWMHLCDALRRITEAAMASLPEQIRAGQESRRRGEACAAMSDPWLRARHRLHHARRGALAFSHLARHGFMAVLLLRSLVRMGHLSADELDAFLASIRTVATDMEEDGAQATTKAQWDAFVARYGHLRPGTYDASIPRYDAEPERFLRPFTQRPPSPPSPSDDAGFTERIRAAVDASALNVTAEQLVAFCRDAIRARETSKLDFTKSLSDAIEDLIEAAGTVGLSREEAVHMPLSYFLDQALQTSQDQDIAAWLAQRGRDHQSIIDAVELPPLIGNAEELIAFESPAQRANFVTRRSVVAPVAGPDNAANLDGAIALIHAADPGFDWIFGTGIVGLVTCYGGANSHMTIRAAELELPAAIGVGEERFDQLCRAAEIQLDCAAQRIEVIR